MRYLNNSTTTPTAVGLMGYFYRSFDSTSTFPMNYTVIYAQRDGYTPINYAGTLSSTEVFSQIDSDRPIYISARRYDSATGEYHYHAIVLRGYNRNTDKYSIWNPWYSYYENMNLIAKVYTTASGIEYTWNRTIYDW